MSRLIVRLRPRSDRRVRAGHPWIFSNEIDGDVANLPAGGTVDVVDARGAFLGRGTANPSSLISVRLLTTGQDDIDSEDFWVERLAEAKDVRRLACPGQNALRLVHAEGDGLPGLVVDRYGDQLVVQLTTQGTDRRRDVIVAALQRVWNPTGITERSEGRARELEGLPDVRGPIAGTVPETVDIDEGGVPFRVTLGKGAKTGHFFDQALNRDFAGRRCDGADVLDVYSHTGGFGQHALAHGARHVLSIDRSAEALNAAAVNAGLLGASERHEVRVADGRDALRALAAEGRRFDVVCLDPPAFAKSRKVAGNALRAYGEINALGMALLRPAGLLFTSSCSWHIEEDRFVEVVAAAAHARGATLRVIRRGEQAPDHPVRPAVPETRYLKHLALDVRHRA